MGEVFKTSKQVHQSFIQGQEYINRNLIKKKWLPTNNWWGRFKTGTFKTNSGLDHKGHRLQRITPPETLDFKKLEQDECNSNVGEFTPQHVVLGGSDTYRWFPEELQLVTDWINLDQLVYNEFPVEEMNQIEEGLQNINRWIWEEFSRYNYYAASENKWVSLLPCDPGANEYAEGAGLKLIVNGQGSSRKSLWQFGVKANGLVDPNVLLVALPYTQLYRVAPLSIETCEDASIALSYEDPDYVQESVQMYELVVPDVRVSRQLQHQQNLAGNNYMIDGQYNVGDLDPKLGIQRICYNFALRFDRLAPRYSPGSQAEQEARQGVGGASFDYNDPNTWAILHRVHPYKREKSELGIHNEVNPEYQYAPYSLSAIHQPRVIEFEKVPQGQSIGSAKKMDAVPEGQFSWTNPDWPVNIRRNKGFWLGCWQMAAHPREVELGHVFLHRLDHRVKIVELLQDIPTKVEWGDASPYCVLGVGGAPNTVGTGTEENRVVIEEHTDFDTNL